LQNADIKFIKAIEKAEKKLACTGNKSILARETDACVVNLVETVKSEPPSLAGITAAHNAVRAEVGVRPLVWNASLAATAQAWADQCIDADANGLIDHNPDSSVNHPYYVGENIFASVETANVNTAVSTWAAEEANYDYASNTCTVVCGHYTQIVWAESLEVGCAISSCPGLTFKSSIVCNYGPGGNIVGEKPY